jgi:hypothetical protein
VWTGQIGRREISAVDVERRFGRDPVGASTHRVVLGSARPHRTPQTSRGRRKNNRWDWKSLGFVVKCKYETHKVNMFDRFDDTQSAAAPHIYLGGEDLPCKEMFYSSTPWGIGLSCPVGWVSILSVKHNPCSMRTGVVRCTDNKLAQARHEFKQQSTVVDCAAAAYTECDREQLKRWRYALACMQWRAAGRRLRLARR